MYSVKTKRRNRLKWLLPVCLMGLTAAFAFYPADEWQDKITQTLEQYSKRFPQEKVYLQQIGRASCRERVCQYV